MNEDSKGTIAMVSRRDAILGAGVVGASMAAAETTCIKWLTTTSRRAPTGS